MPIIFNKPEEKKTTPQIAPKSDYIWDRKQRKLVKKGEQEVVSTKDDYIWDAVKKKMIKKPEFVEPQFGTYWDPRIKQLVTKPEPPKPIIYKREIPSKELKKHSDHYIKVEDGSLHKYYNTKSQYLKDMAALDNL